MTKCEKLVATGKKLVAFATPMVAMSISDYNNIIYILPSLFYETWLGAEIFVELYDSTAVVWMFKFVSMGMCTL